MKRSYSLRLKLYLQSAVPGLITAALLVISVTNFQMPGSAEFMPSFMTMSIFFWMIYAPRLMPQWLCFALGVFYDAINGMILGQSAVINLILWWAIYSQRRFLIKENFSVLYGIFIIASLACSALSLMIFGMANARIFFTPSILIQWFFTIACYPLIHLVFIQIYLAMIRNFRYVGWR